MCIAEIAEKTPTTKETSKQAANTLKTNLQHDTMQQQQQQKSYKNTNIPTLALAMRQRN